MDVWATLSREIDQNRACVLVSVLEARGSAPRETGVRMIVRQDGGFYGTIGGGTLEWEAIATARQRLKDRRRAFHEQRMALGPDLGQCCGGHVTLGFETFGPEDRAELLPLVKAEETNRLFQTHGILDDTGRRKRTVLTKPESDPDNPIRKNADGGLIEVFGETTRLLYLFGAGHVGRAVTLALAQLPFRVRWIDPRSDAFPRHVPLNASPEQWSDPTEALKVAPTGTFVLVMTHDHVLDEALIAAALQIGVFGWIGLIGSETKRARFMKRLRARGLTEERLASLVCPIGLSGIRSKTPAAIAASVAAQLLMADEALTEAGSVEASPDQREVPLDVAG